MEAHVLLADAAQRDQSGKIHALGLGWSNIGTPLPPHAIVLLVKVPWDQANRRHNFQVELVDADGHPVTTSGPVGEQPVKVAGGFETGRPPGLPAGTPLDVAVPFNIGGGLPLPPGRYTWNLTIDGDAKEGWSTSFLVKASQPSNTT
jgi:hypothetical protein